MNAIAHDNIWGKLWRRWLLLYIVIFLTIYVPGTLCNIYTGTLKAPTTCETPFFEDYAFHINWLLVLPAFLMLIPTYVKNANDCIRRHLGVEFIPYNMKNGLFKGASRLFRNYILGLFVFFFLASSIVAALNIWSCQKAGTLKTWYTPSLETIPTSVFFFSSSAIPVFVAVVFLAYHYSVMVTLKRMVSSDKTTELLWSVTPGGPIYKAFSSCLRLLYPIAFLPIVIIISRAKNLNLSLYDPVIVINFIAIPLCILLWVFFPFSLSSIPKFLRTNKKELLHNNAVKMSKIWDTLNKGIKEADKKLLEEMDYLQKEKTFIGKNYPLLSLSKQARIIPVMVSSLPIVLSLAPALAPVLFDLLK